MRRRRVSFAERRRSPGEYPEVCGECIPERRFKKPKDIGNHNRMKHGILPTSGVYGSNSVMFHSYSLPTPSRTFNAVPTSSTTFFTRQTLSLVSPDVRCQLYGIRRDQLSSFVHSYIEPNTEYNRSCNAVIHRLCQFMQNNLPQNLRPAKILKSGSLGKGTAVKGKSDADLVVFLDRTLYDSITKLIDRMPSLLKTIKSYLGDHGGCRTQNSTSHAVKASVSCHAEHTHDVDILPSIDIVGSGRRLVEIFQEMRMSSNDVRQYYSAALAPLQIDFVKYQPTKVKQLIGLVKFWRKTAFEESTGNDGKRLPSSYPLELITIGEWKRNCGRTDFDLRKGLYNVLKAIASYQTLHHVWTDNYSIGEVSRDLMSSFYVIDPANPFNNVMDSCNCWPDVADEARIGLRTPLFEGLSGNENWME